jgi:hypothetical protein
LDTGIIAEVATRMPVFTRQKRNGGFSQKIERYL